MAGKFVVKKGTTGKFRFNLVATNGQVAATNRPIVNWDVAAADWRALQTRAHDDWIRISQK